MTFPLTFSSSVYNLQLTWNKSDYENPTAGSVKTSKFVYWSKYSGGTKWWLAIGE